VYLAGRQIAEEVSGLEPAKGGVCLLEKANSRLREALDALSGEDAQSMAH
jgi:hypothetical protein